MSIFIVFMNNKNIISKIRRSKVTDYAALKLQLKSSHDPFKCMYHISFEDLALQNMRVPFNEQVHVLLVVNLKMWWSL